MNRQEPAVNQEDDPAERETATYLRAHPDFFTRHDELLSALHIPHGPGGAVSLIQRQVEVLRGQVDALKRREREMHDLARENECLHGKLHRFTLSMIDARSLSDVLIRLRAFLETEFKVELIVVLLSERVAGDLDDGDFYRKIAPDGETFTAFDACLKSRHALCGRLKHEQLRILFGERAVEIRSAALMSLEAPREKQDVLGLLAIGSLEKERFDGRMGTVFLDNMADIIAQTIAAHA